MVSVSYKLTILTILTQTSSKNKNYKLIIIDGNNLIHCVPEIKKFFTRDKVAAQISIIEIVKSRTVINQKIIFVFDGHGVFKKDGAIFSEGKTADEVIREKIEKSSNSSKLKIVSSDSEITGFAKVCGCIIQRSEDFWKEINPVKGKNINQNYIYDEFEKPERMSRREIDEFKKYFS